MMTVEGHGDCRVVQRRQYDHSRGLYYAVVQFPSGREAVVTSRNHAGPYRVAGEWTIRPPAQAG
jgi:hypothetical protein